MKKFSGDLEFSNIVIESIKISCITVFVTIMLKISYAMAMRITGVNHYVLVVFFIATLAMYGVYMYKKFS